MLGFECGGSLVQNSGPTTGGGSIPTPSLQVYECPLSDIKQFIEQQHYSHSVFGVTPEFCFKVLYGTLLVGGAIFGKPAGMGVLKKYSENGKLKTTELRRFALHDICTRNSESKTLAFMFRALKRKGVKRILSYADPAAGHTGVIYKATGFNLLGKTAKRKHILWRGKKYPDRNIHQVNFPYHKILRNALKNGKAKRFENTGKVYLLEGFMKTQAKIRLIRQLNKLAVQADRFDVKLPNGGEVGSLLGSMAVDLQMMWELPEFGVETHVKEKQEK